MYASTTDFQRSWVGKVGFVLAAMLTRESSVSFWVIVPSQSRIQWIRDFKGECLVDMLRRWSCFERGMEKVMGSLDTGLNVKVRRSERDIQHAKVCLVVDY
jgi:hypothetical protein